MKKISLLASLAALALAGNATAQVCNGFPTVDGQASLSVLANFPKDIDEFGVEGSYDLAGPLAVNAAYIRDSADGSSLNTFRAGASFDVTPALRTVVPATVSVCPTASVAYTHFSGITLLAIPVGVGVGATLPMGTDGRSALMPYVVPEVVIARISGGGDSAHETNFGLRGGAMVSFSQFFVGGEVNKVFTSGSDPVFGVRLGVKL
jgi:hypothetical protein